MPDTGARVAVLLSTHNGAEFLGAQLDSLVAQTCTDWRLHWRDDGSSDATAALMQRFRHGPGRGRVVVHPPGRLGVTASYLALLRAADAEFVAFADQDDVWLPDKLARGVRALGAVPPGVPALYCARQVLVDAGLRRLGLSCAVRRPAGFPAALTQNIATGCTVMLNRAAARLVAGSRQPGSTLHDWWSYLVVAAAGGTLLLDETPTVLYRQHPANLVGAPRSMTRRAVAALRRGPGVFMGVLRDHVAALASQPHLLCPEARAALGVIDAALREGPRRRVAALRLPGLHRQTWQETLLFRVWFMMG